MFEIKGNEDLLFSTGVFKVEPNGEIWRVRKFINGREVKCTPARAEGPTGKGYKRIRMRVNGRQVQARAHRLVWRALNGEIPAGLTVNHKDGDKINNHPDNLELMTNYQNVRHAIEVMGKDHNGKKNPNAKLTNEDVIDIRRRCAAGESQGSIAKIYGISRSNVSNIKARRFWTHI